MLYGIIGILTIIIIILGVKLGQKISIDNKQLEIYKKEISEAEGRVEKLRFQKDELTKDIKDKNYGLQFKFESFSRKNIDSLEIAWYHDISGEIRMH